ncbi:hypothetical protein CTAYLR_009173 [Chrysophaeum taylorii]|uniref:ABC transporter domain-containing protein n=1 Tax=Chrysophaeum taylorii TaxID=2483200 RepID=A0AAD7UK14_9STRA|nr:hypothetical protein CTAYLR_009173 [Chrysophaeum taylorii]
MVAAEAALRALLLVSIVAHRARGGAAGDDDCTSNTWQTLYYEGGDVKQYATTDACQESFTVEAGYYSPAGAAIATSLAEAEAYFMNAWLDNITTSRCRTIYENSTQTYYLRCACTQGFLCLENSALPIFCPKKYYCRTPKKYKKCKHGHYCKEGSVYGTKCSLSSCPSGSSAPEGSGQGTIVFIAFTLVVFVIFKLYERHADIKARREYQEMDAYLEDLVAHTSSTTAAAAAANPMTMSSAAVVVEEEGGEPSAATTGGGGGGKNSTIHEFVIEFKDVCYTLPNGVAIMKNASGQLAPRTSTAIMGASGAGKTTIMNLITGKAKKTSGQIFVNGEECESLAPWKSKVGFVPQDDIMHRRLTVLQNVTFSAELRLPASMPAATKTDKVRATLATLKLDHVRHSIIGDERKRGVSGGQRKRVNVALEIVADPSVLFLDEPTSGLDSVSATELAKMLGSIALSSGMTLAAVIHSPGPAAFKAFTHLLLLQTGGTVVYAGERAGVEPYFSSLGFVFPNEDEPLADYLMGCIAGRIQPEIPANCDPVEARILSTWDHMTGFGDVWVLRKADKDGGEEQPSESRGLELTSAERASILSPADAGVLKSLELAFRDWFVHFKADASELPSAIAGQCVCGQKESEKERAGFRRQYVLCLARAFRQQYTSFTSHFFGVVLVNFGVGLFLATLIGTDLNVLGAYPSDICNKQYPALAGSCRDLQEDAYVSAFQFVSFILLGSGAAVASGTFGAEQIIFFREASTGLNTVAYFFAKVTGDIPMVLSSTICAFAGLMTSFVSPMPPAQIFAGLAVVFTFAYLSGYFLSFVLPYSACGLAAVGWGVVWGLLFSGLVLVMSEDGNKTFMAMSVPRWFNEAVYYASTVHPFSKVRRGSQKGEDYYDFSRENQYYRFFQTYSEAMGWACVITLAWLFIDLVVLVFTNLDKKK